MNKNATLSFRSIATSTMVLLFTANLVTVNLAIAEVSPPPSSITPDNKANKKSKSVTLTNKNQDKPKETQKQFPVPDLVIRYKDGAKIEEYRLNGHVRYAKITPSVGPAYYLIDSTGDGIFDQRHNQLDNPPIQTWLLYSW